MTQATALFIAKWCGLEKESEKDSLMRDAVIVSTARTPIGKAYRGAFNLTQAPVLMAHAIRAAVSRAGLEGGEIEDFTMGSALTQGHGRRQPPRATR